MHRYPGWLPMIRTSVTLCIAAALSACGVPQDSAPTEPQAEAKRGARLESLVAISSPSPFAPQGCGQPENPIYATLPDDVDGGDGTEFGDEADLSLVANPADSRHLVAAWVQDAGLGIVTATSFDGGKTWQRVAVPDLSFCTGAEEERHLHTRLAFGPDDRIYLSTEADDGFFPDPRQPVTQRIPVAHSVDGGASWNTSFVDDGGVNDAFKGLSTIAAEPDMPGAALVAWHVGEPQLATGKVLVSRTTDGGESWTRHVVRSGSADDLPFNRILALRNGDLLMFTADNSVRAFAAAGSPAAPAKAFFVQRSIDKGVSWSEPVAISTDAAGQWPAAAEGPDGRVYASWVGTNGAQNVAASVDHGATWRVLATNVARPDHSLGPSLAVNEDGALGIVYTDHRNAAAEAPVQQRDTWLAYSTDRGATWQELHLASHQLLDRDLGLLQETIASRHGFAAVFVAGPPLAQNGHSDAFFVSIQILGKP